MTLVVTPNPVHAQPDLGSSGRHPAHALVARWSSLAVVIFSIKALLEYAYAVYVVPLFGYSGLSLDYSISKHLESYLYLAIILVFVPARVKRPSDFLVFTFLLVGIVPILGYYGLSNASRPALLLMLSSFAIVSGMRHLTALRFSFLRVHPVFVTTAMALCVAATVSAMVAVGGMGGFNLNPFDVYDLRSESNERFGGLLAYPVIWITKVMNPLLILVAVRVRRYGVTLMLVGLQLLLYGMTSHKAVAAYPLLVVGVYFLLSRTRRPLLVMSVSMFTGVLATMLVAEFSEFTVLLSWFVRRAFIVPAYLDFQYIAFFAENPKVYFSSSFIGGLVPYPYSEPYQLVIGEYAFAASPPPWANAGYLATGYMHAGAIGVVGYAGLVGLLLKLTDSLSRGGPSVAFTTAFVVVPYVILFTTADLTTTLLSHGLALSLMLLWLIRLKSPHRAGPAAT